MINTNILEAYLHCHTKCWLYFTGEEGRGNLYSDWVRERNKSYFTEWLKQFRNHYHDSEVIIAPSEPINIAKGNWKFVFDYNACHKDLVANIHAVECVVFEKNDRSSQLITIRLIYSNKLSKNDKMLASFDAFVLSEALKVEISRARIIYGGDYSTTKIKSIT